MLFERIHEDGLAQASYFIGCQKENTAVVVDPRRDVQVYLDLAEKHDMTIQGVLETHIHADYLSGTRELAHRTGATPYLSAEGGQDWQYGFDGERLHHGDIVTLGNITLTALHTPGHTPEHLTYLVTDGAVSDQPGFILTGDFVFVGDVGRPDLLDEAANGKDTRFQGAKDLFRSLKEVFLSQPDYVQVHPAHGAGSPCGKALGAIPSSTVGYERRFAWWGPYLKNDDEQGFIDQLLNGQPDAHAYFARMKRENRDGPNVLGELATVEPLVNTEVRQKLDANKAIFVDTRPHAAVHQGTVAGSLNIPTGPGAANHAAWVIDPETNNHDLIILATSQESAEQFQNTLLRTGIDTVRWFTTSLDGLPAFTPPLVKPTELKDMKKAAVVDVRTRNEYANGHIPGARQLSGGSALWHTDELPREGTLVTYCQSGARNSVVASGLRRAGFDVVELDGSFLGWENSGGEVI